MFADYLLIVIPAAVVPSTVLVSPSPLPEVPVDGHVEEVAAPPPSHAIVYDVPDIYTVAPTTITVTATEVICPEEPDSCQTLTPAVYAAPEHTVTITKTSQTYVCPYTPVHEEAPVDTGASVEAPIEHVEEAPVEHVEEAPVEHVEEPVEHVEEAPAPVEEHVEEPDVVHVEEVAEEPEEPKEPVAVYEEPKAETPKVETEPEIVHVQTEPQPEPVKEEEKPEESHESGKHAEIKPNGNRWAMTYTPYTKDGQCSTAEQVDSEISVIASKGFTAVRLYATDCDALKSIGDACEKHGLKMIIGVFIDSAGIGAAGEQVEQIMSWGQWHLVEMFVIGNEALFNGYCTAGELAAFIKEVKQKARSAGYNGPCTTAETLNVLESDGATLCDAIDVLGANLHPFFNPSVSAEDAGDFVQSQIEIARGICPGKEPYNLECGWPNNGNANGAAVPGRAEQRRAINDILDKIGQITVVLSCRDDDWKGDGAHGVESHWGACDAID